MHRNVVLACAVTLGSLATLGSWLAVSAPAPAEIIEVEPSTLTAYLGGATLIQGVKPQVLQRGTRIEGSLRARGPHGMTIAANPFGTAWSGSATHNGIDLATGSYAPTEIDIALPAPGFSWIIGRTYNAVQKSSGSHHVSNGPQGKGWFQSSMPEIVLYEPDPGNMSAGDTIYLVYGADRFAEFKRHSATDTEFNGRQGAAGAFQYLADNGGSSSEPDTYIWTDQRGTTWTFFTPDTSDSDASPAHGQLWKIEDAAGNVAYVGDATTASTAISSGYDGSGRITTAYDAADRHYSYAYTSGRLTEIEVETKSGGTWASPTGLETVALVQYTYYVDLDDFGQEGDLEMVKITDFGTEGAGDLVRVQYYRYWEGTYNATTNPGHEHSIKYVYDFEGTRAFDWGEEGTETPPAFDDGFRSASESTLEPYASAYFEYDSSHRVREVWFNGECGCAGAGTGTHSYGYEANPNYTDTSGYQTVWAARTIVGLPDGTYLTQYFDEVGQPLHQIFTDDDPANTSPAPSRWVTKVVRDANGIVSAIHTPSNVTGYTHAASTMSISTSTSAGLVWTFARVASGDLRGFLQDRKFQEGTNGTEYYIEKLAYTSTSLTVGATSVIRPFLSSRKSYHASTSTGTSGYDETSYSYTFHSGTLAPAALTTTLPGVSTANNGPGSGSPTSFSQHHRLDGRVDFEKSLSGIISYREYEGGLLVKSIEDADTTLDGTGEDFEGISIPTGFASSGSPLHEVTTFTHDPQGRRVTTTLTSGRVMRVYHTKLADNRRVTLAYPKYEAGSPATYHGPVDYTVRNQAGKVVAEGRIALSGNQSTMSLSGHVDESDDDPIAAVGLGSLASLRTSIYSDTGAHLEEKRVYFDVPSVAPGTAGTHYDATVYGEDDMGRRVRVKEASGTIRRSVYDARGRVVERWMGTNDSSFPGGEPSGTDNMVRTEVLVYDGGSDGGNSYLTSRDLHLDGSGTNKRTYAYEHDLRGRVLLETNPTAPHRLHSYDNLGRRLATGRYSSTGSISAGDDPATTTSDRLALDRSEYDELGRAWKTVRHAIDASDGSSLDSLDSLTWFDAAGRVAKVRGPRLAKTAYDRLGRVTHEFVLGGDDDTTYAHAMAISGDAVLEEHQTVYEPGTGNVLMRARISRHHDDRGSGATSGPLDTNADGDPLKYTATNIEGRIQITGLWYDGLDRLVEEVRFGTHGGADFDRDGMSVPGRSDTALRTSYVYGTDGRVSEVTDPKGIVRRTEYDAAGRLTAVIRNYDPGVNSGQPSGSDVNATLRYEYTNGLRTKYIADLPSGSTDQETLYIHGTTVGTPAASAIASGHLLRATVLPDSTNSATSEGDVNTDDSDLVSYAYNAQGEEVRRKDQAGNVFERSYDAAGRLTQKRVTTVATGFDDAVRRIETAYDALGRRETVTQLDTSGTSGGTILDQVRFGYDGWANITSYRQDVNSAVGASGSEDDYEVSYTWAKATGGRNTVRLDTTTLPSGAVVEFAYRSLGGRFDADVSRVTTLTHGTTVVVSYDYNGLGEVVGTSYPQPGIRWNLFEDASGSGDYPDLDRFNRVKHSRWSAVHTSRTDLYDVELTYDRNSNITSIVDNVHTGFDVKYDIDGLDRVTRAHEGTLSAGSITSPTRDQQWTLDQVGNWERDKLDLTGDGTYTGPDEWDDCRTHNDVNEILTRDLDCSTTSPITLAHDAAGNLTDDGQDYKYVYDAFNRLRKILAQNNDLISEHRYNGLGHRIAVHLDTNDDGVVDGDDDWEYLFYDERWRLIARFIEAEASPRQEFLHHQAGLDGRGGSSYIDLVILRDRDTDENGTLDERVYYCQNWRADVSALVTDAGQMLEWVKYSAYGRPFGLPGGDANSDGSCDSADIAQVQAWINGSAYDVRGDINLDGTLDSSDEQTIQNEYVGLAAGLDALSHTDSQIGHAGTVYLAGTQLAAVRGRAYSSKRGMWLQRDGESYRDGPNLYQYGLGSPMKYTDPSGRYSVLPGGGGGGFQGAGGGFVLDEVGPPDPLEPPPKTPCEELWDHVVQEHGANHTWVGYTGCYNGEPLVCVFMDNVASSYPASPATLAAIAECIAAHEAVHEENIECDPDVEGPADGTNDNTNEEEAEAYSAQINCYNSLVGPNVPEDERALASAKNDACTNYTHFSGGQAHGGCP